MRITHEENFEESLHGQPCIYNKIVVYPFIHNLIHFYGTAKIAMGTCNVELCCGLWMGCGILHPIHFFLNGFFSKLALLLEGKEDMLGDK